MEGNSIRFVITGILLIVIGLGAMSMIGPTLINGGCTALGAAELIYASYLNLK